MTMSKSEKTEDCDHENEKGQSEMVIVMMKMSKVRKWLL